MALIREGAPEIITGFSDFWRRGKFFNRQFQTVNIGRCLLPALGCDCVAVNVLQVGLCAARKPNLRHQEPAFLAGKKPHHHQQPCRP